MRSTFVKGAACAAALAVYGSASAFLWMFSDPMTGLQETPPNASTASGVTFDDVANILTIDVNASGFLGPVTAAHGRPNGWCESKNDNLNLQLQPPQAHSGN